MGTTLHTLSPPAGARKQRKRVGRGVGSGRGKTSTRGMKGQLARNNAMPASFEGGQMPIHRRIPKRGFVNLWRTEAVGVNVGRLEGAFAKGAEVTVELLREKGLVPKRGKIVKLLGDGEIKTALKISVHRVSKSAREKIEKAGGSITIVELSPADTRRDERKRTKREARRTKAEAKKAAIEAKSDKGKGKGKGAKGDKGKGAKGDKSKGAKGKGAKGKGAEAEGAKDDKPKAKRSEKQKE